MLASRAAFAALALALTPAVCWSTAGGWQCRSETESFANCSVTEVIERMRARPQHAVTQSQGAYALGLHALDADWIVDEGRRAAVIEAGGLAEVLRAMSHMPSEAAVQGHGAYALGFLAPGDVGGEGEASALAVQHAMAAFALDSEVQASGLFTLAQLLSSEEADDALRSSIGVELKSFELAYRSMMALPSDLGVQANGCFLLAMLASLEPPSLAAAAASSNMWAARGRAAVTAAMAAFPEQEMTQRFGQAVLDSTDAVASAAADPSGTLIRSPPQTQAAQGPPPSPLPMVVAAVPTLEAAARPTAKRPPLPSPPPQYRPAPTVAIGGTGEVHAVAAAKAAAEVIPAVAPLPPLVATARRSTPPPPLPPRPLLPPPPLPRMVGLGK